MSSRFPGDKAAVLFAPRGSGWEPTLLARRVRATLEAGGDAPHPGGGTTHWGGANRTVHAPGNLEEAHTWRWREGSSDERSDATLRQFSGRSTVRLLRQECARQQRLMGLARASS